VAHTYTITFECIARNVSPAVLAAAMIALAPPNAGDMANNALTFVSDTAVLPGGDVARRVLVMTSAGTGPLPDTPVGPTAPLTRYLAVGWLETAIAQACATTCRVVSIVEV
jgi:hypothetical protein